jgi:hypothetical protein
MFGLDETHPEGAWPMSGAADKHGMSVDDFRLLDFYRAEVKHEFNLLAMRSTILVTCQSFLIVPFAILQTAPDFLLVAPVAVAVAVLGIYTTTLIKRPIQTAHESIDGWLVKQRKLLQGLGSTSYMSARDAIEGAAEKSEHDEDHVASVAFSARAPGYFLRFWYFSLAWILIRVVLVVLIPAKK